MDISTTPTGIACIICGDVHFAATCPNGESNILTGTYRGDVMTKDVISNTHTLGLGGDIALPVYRWSVGDGTDEIAKFSGPVPNRFRRWLMALLTGWTIEILEDQ